VSVEKKRKKEKGSEVGEPSSFFLGGGILDAEPIPRDWGVGVSYE